MVTAVATIALTMNGRLEELDRDQFKRVEVELRRWSRRLKPDDPLFEMFADIRVTDFKLMAPAAEAGAKGGLKRAQNLSPEKRREIARKAARARWGGKNGDAS